MALTLPASFNNHSIKQNWLFQLHYDDESAFTGLSFTILMFHKIIMDQ